MNIQEVLQLYPANYPLRRNAWAPETAIWPQNDGTIFYRRFANSYGWEWRPKAVDLAANDWTGAR